MCCLFGIYNYGDELTPSNMKSIISSLGNASMIRGTDATGIAFVNDSKIMIQKAAKSADKFKFNLPNKTVAITGHTRLTTQGLAKFNENNHPFCGNLNTQSFALAHNGIIHNDNQLRKKHKLPSTKIETDSYIAVQLLEQNKLLSIGSIRHMCETVEGSFCFSILDNQNVLYLIKGNNPLAIIHHKELKCYFYASTEQILWNGIVNSTLFQKFKPYFMSKNSTCVEEIALNDNQILLFTKDGTLQYQNFHIRESDYYYGLHMLDGCNVRLSSQNSRTTTAKTTDESEYIEQLKWLALYLGLDETVVDQFLQDGFTFQEIEEWLYGNDFEQTCCEGVIDCV